MKKYRSCLSLFLAILLIMSLLPSSALAEDIAVAEDAIADVLDERPTDDDYLEDVTEQFFEDETEQEDVLQADEESEPIVDGDSVTIGDYTYNITSGVATITKYNGTASTLSVPTSVIYGGVTYKIRTIGSSAFAGNTYIKYLTIPNGIASIGNSAFKNCTNLISITINGDIGDCSSSSTGSSYYNYSVFYNAGANASSLTVAFGSGVTYIPAYLFASASSYSDGYYTHITKLIISDTVTEIGRSAFDNCFDLNSITWGTGLKIIGIYDVDHSS